MFTGGGLISYGPDPIDQFRRAAGHVDRILKGEKPADLPVQAPTKWKFTRCLARLNFGTCCQIEIFSVAWVPA
jgi:ABC-type uncharacterized transport system substrate-binding protein